MYPLCEHRTVHTFILDIFSVTCDTEADAAARISRTGASGGIRGRELETFARFLPIMMPD